MSPFPRDALRPFVLRARGHTGHLPGLEGAEPLDRLDALALENTGFSLALNRANCLAYDGSVDVGSGEGALGMPRWVLLDCALLPSAVFGFHVRRSLLPTDLADRIDPEGAAPTLAVSEYIGVPGLARDLVVGASLFSLFPGFGLGRRTKALALLAGGWRRQVGVTQWSNPSLKLHLAFGPLRLLEKRVAVHSRPHETFVYGLDVPAPEVLRSIFAGERRQAVALPEPAVTVEPVSGPRLDAAIAPLGPHVAIVHAELDTRGRVREVGLAPVSIEPDDPWGPWWPSPVMGGGAHG